MMNELKFLGELSLNSQIPACRRQTFYLSIQHHHFNTDEKPWQHWNPGNPCQPITFLDNVTVRARKHLTLPVLSCNFMALLPLCWTFKRSSVIKRAYWHFQSKSACIVYSKVQSTLKCPVWFGLSADSQFNMVWTTIKWIQARICHLSVQLNKVCWRLGMLNRRSAVYRLLRVGIISARELGYTVLKW